MKHVLFDLETELLAGDLNLDRYVPAITIGATLTDGGTLKLWYEQDDKGNALGGTLGQDTAGALVRYLQTCVQDGYTVVTWNGAGFDFRVLAQASDMAEACVELSIVLSA